jgi:hypothetical protein
MVGFHKIMENGGEVRLVVEIVISTMDIIVVNFGYQITLLDNEESICMDCSKYPC